MNRPAELEVLVVTTAAEMRDALEIRRSVFIEEQRVPEDLEIDQHDADPALVSTALHVLARRDGQPVGTGRLLLAEPDALLHIGRVAVLAAHRRHGVGRTVMLALQVLARERGAASVTLGAQLHAISFYERLGYVASGPVFLDAGIEHRRMDLQL
jgi:predicted GNAT family N-acyltransferase